MSHLSPSNSSCRLVTVWGSVMTSQCGGVMWLHPLWKSMSIISDDWSIPSTRHKTQATGPMEEERSCSALRWTQLLILSSPGKTAAHAVFTDLSPSRGGSRGFRRPCWREVLSEALPCFCTLSFCVTILNLYFITNNNIFLHEMCALYVKLLITIEIIREDDLKYLYMRLFIWNNPREYSEWSYSSRWQSSTAAGFSQSLRGNLL